MQTNKQNKTLHGNEENRVRKMKGISSKPTGALDLISKVKVDDNSGAKILRVIAKEGHSGRRRRRPKIGIGQTFKGSVVKGNVKMKGKVVRAVLTRQKKEYRRSSGLRVKFEDNAAVLITETGEPVGSEIKGVVAKEAGKRFPKVATISKNVV